ncbi:MAG: hypothetical protein JSR85_08395 [Proteobacteria bacterium]|nr:hypothetical protein [Pseudomonadota bacterium]
MSDHEYWSPQQIVSSGKYPFTIGQIRHYLIYRHKNGLNKVVRKVGKRIVFRMDLFNAWIESQAQGGAS